VEKARGRGEEVKTRCRCYERLRVVTKDIEVKLEEVEASNALGGVGEDGSWFSINNKHYKPSVSDFFTFRCSRSVQPCLGLIRHALMSVSENVDPLFELVSLL
jgi:hypothetical protein